MLICVSKKRQEILTKKIIASTEESSAMFCGNWGGGWGGGGCVRLVCLQTRVVSHGKARFYKALDGNVPTTFGTVAAIFSPSFFFLTSRYNS